MYQFSYVENLEDSIQDARSRERQTLQRAIELLELGQRKGIRSIEAAEGLNYFDKLWHCFIEDLAKIESDVPESLRAQLISIGIWITNEVQRIRLGKAENLKSLVEICTMIRDGLSSQD